MLGLGDIVVPGVYIGFLIKFGRLVRPKTQVYRNASLIAYAMSLLCCGAFLILFDQAQPALLYIVPALLITTFALGFYRGEIVKLYQGFDLEQEFSGQPRKNNEANIPVESSSSADPKDKTEDP